MRQVQNRKHLLELVVPGLAEKRPSVMRGDKIYVMIATDLQLEKTDSIAPQENKEYEGFVHEVEENTVLLGFSEKLLKRCGLPYYYQCFDIYFNNFSWISIKLYFLLSIY